MFTQLAKMLFLATFFPVVEDEDEDLNAEMPFEFVTVSKNSIRITNWDSWFKL